MIAIPPTAAGSLSHCGSPWPLGLIHRRSFLRSSFDQILKNRTRAARALSLVLKQNRAVVHKNALIGVLFDRP